MVVRGKCREKRGFARDWEKWGWRGKGKRRGLEGVKWGEKWGEKGLEWLWDKGLTERKCRRKRGIEGWEGDWGGMGGEGSEGGLENGDD